MAEQTQEGGIRGRDAQTPHPERGDPRPGPLVAKLYAHNLRSLTFNTVSVFYVKILKVQIATLPVATKVALGGRPRCRRSLWKCWWLPAEARTEPPCTVLGTRRPDHPGSTAGLVCGCCPATTEPAPPDLTTLVFS